MSTIRTTAIFKCIVKFRNGTHKVVRMTIDKVAKMTAAFRQMREMPWLTRRYDDFFSEIGIRPQDLESCKFINERTGEMFLTLA